MLLVVVLVVLASRLTLAGLGGQFFFPDESRYVTSRQAAGLITQGKWKAGLALPFEGGDHVGFKFLGIVPALIERGTVEADWVPGVFWSLFSVGSVLLLGGLVRRLGGTAGAQRWVLLAAASSATLFYYSRHLLPYDASMCLALASLYVATGGPSLGRAWGAGILAGMAFAIYYGYWPLVGVVLVWGTLHGRVSWLRCMARGAWAALGAGSVVLAAWGINRAWGNGQLIERARTFSGTINQGDYRASVTTWEFLVRAEGVWALLGLGFSLWIVRRWRQVPAEARAGLAPGMGAAVAAAAIWILFIVTGDLLHTFTVYGRLIRQMTPVLCLGLGVGAAAWLEWRPAIWRRCLAGLLVVNAIWLMGRAYQVRYPGDFLHQWRPWMAEHQGDRAGPGAYYRLMNVTRYFHEVEVLRTPPLETIVAVDHPLSFEPYLYELFGAEERGRRRLADHRMKVVKMPVAPSREIRGDPYGLVRMKVRFQGGRPGEQQPLLSTGPFRGGELFFVQYLSATRVRLGCEVFGRAAFFSEELEVDSGRVYEVGCFGGGMLPPEDDSGPAAVIARQAGVGHQLGLTLDGRDLIQRLTPTNRGRAAQVYAGVNVIGAESTAAEFSGEIMSVVRGGFPPVIEPPKEVPVYGAIKLRLSLPIPGGGQPEPLVVVGDPGRAVLGFMVPLKDGRVQLGVEVWGTGVGLSQPLTLRGGDTDEVVFEFGGLFPPEGAPEWGALPPAQQAVCKRQVRIWLNGRVVMTETMATPDFGPTVIVTGTNPVGGSYVGAVYSGQVLSVERLAPAETPE